MAIAKRTPRNFKKGFREVLSKLSVFRPKLKTKIGDRERRRKYGQGGSVEHSKLALGNMVKNRRNESITKTSLEAMGEYHPLTNSQIL